MKNIGVFLGAKMPTDPHFAAVANELANELVARKRRIVYGGANIGLMGVLANTVLDLNGEIIGVIPEKILTTEIAHSGLTELHRVNSMQERKILLAELSDAFIIFPGGLGTLEELFEIWNAMKIDLHKKPIGILNINGYYDSLILFLKNAVKHGFLKSKNLDSLIVSDSPAKLLDLMDINNHEQGKYRE